MTPVRDGGWGWAGACSVVLGRQCSAQLRAKCWDPYSTGAPPCTASVSGMMIGESSGLSETYFNQFKKEDDAFLMGAGEISVAMNPQHLAERWHIVGM